MSERMCDWRCHNASEEKCTCICGGRNHGRIDAPTYTLVNKAFSDVSMGKQQILQTEAS